jgi:hypothetical protein
MFFITLLFFFVFYLYRYDKAQGWTSSIAGPSKTCGLDGGKSIQSITGSIQSITGGNRPLDVLVPRRNYVPVRDVMVLSLYVSICVCVCIYTCVCVYVCMCVCVCTCVYLYMYVCVCVCVCVCECICLEREREREREREKRAWESTGWGT